MYHEKIEVSLERYFFYQLFLVKEANGLDCYHRPSNIPPVHESKLLQNSLFFSIGTALIIPLGFRQHSSRNPRFYFHECCKTAKFFLHLNSMQGTNASCSVNFRGKTIYIFTEYCIVKIRIINDK